MACPKLLLTSTVVNTPKSSPGKMGCLFFGSVGTGTYVQSLNVVDSSPVKVEVSSIDDPAKASFFESYQTLVPIHNTIAKRKKRRRRHIKEQNLYMQLSEAMECIEHICTDGCTLVGPTNIVDDTKSTSTVAFGEKSKPCKAFSTCYGLQLLIRHFAVCKRRSNEKGCLRCKRMLQLLRLHSSICDQPESCRVPLCRQLKKRGEQDKKMAEDTKWKLLVRRVVSAKAMSSLCQSKKNKCDGEAEGLVRIRKGFTGCR